MSIPLSGARIGLYGDLLIRRENPINLGGILSIAVMYSKQWDGPDDAQHEAVEILSRADVEALRDLCDEALR